MQANSTCRAHNAIPQQFRAPSIRRLGGGSLGFILLGGSQRHVVHYFGHPTALIAFHAVVQAERSDENILRAILQPYVRKQPGSSNENRLLWILGGLDAEPLTHRYRLLLESPGT